MIHRAWSLYSEHYTTAFSIPGMTVMQAASPRSARFRGIVRRPIRLRAAVSAAVSARCGNQCEKMSHAPIARAEDASCMTFAVQAWPHGTFGSRAGAPELEGRPHRQRGQGFNGRPSRRRKRALQASSVNAKLPEVAAASWPSSVPVATITNCSVIFTEFSPAGADSRRILQLPSVLSSRASFGPFKHLVLDRCTAIRSGGRTK